MAERDPGASESRGLFHYHIALAKMVEMAAEAALAAEYDATHDSMTGALNRNGLKKYLESAEAPKAMLLVDVTNFKSINDTHGYSVGDQVIGKTYEILNRCIRPHDIVARWGGDEFVVILNGEAKPAAPEKLIEERRAERAREEHIAPIKKRIDEEMRMVLDDEPGFKELNLDLAVGGVLWPGNTSIEDLVGEAEVEMKLHKVQQHQNDTRRTA